MPLLIYLTDIKLSQAQISNITQSGRSFGSWLANLGKSTSKCYFYSILLIYLTSNAINKFERKTSGKGAVRAGKGFALSISNEDMNEIIKVI